MQHPLIAYDLAKSKMADLQAEADRNRLAATARPARKQQPSGDPGTQRWTLRRLFNRLPLADAAG